MADKEKDPNNGKSLYEKLGVDARKENVREIFDKVNDNEYPGAFVNIISDPYSKKRVLTMHQDGDGSKFVQRMLHYYESGDEDVFLGMVDDGLSMNTGDIAASGFVFEPWLISNVLNQGLPKDLKDVLMRAVARRSVELKALYADHGFSIKSLGGETADLPDQVKSGVFDIAITAWAQRKHLITGNVQGGDLIFGFPSDGQAAWEEKVNSGMMSNGLTLARSCLMHRLYNEKYPELKRTGDFYKGRFRYDDLFPDSSLPMTVGEAIVSPTRQWAIVIKTVIQELEDVGALSMLHGISMNTGGGATKIANIGKGSILYIKDMPPPPPLFHLIQKESQERWVKMYQDFNCGVGIDVVGENNPIFIGALKTASRKCKLPLYRLGTCQKLLGETRKNEVQLNTSFGTFNY